MTKKTVRLPRTAVSLIAASGLAVTGAAALATGWVATATPGDPHQVWVCKYVQKPHQNEVLKAGKNPILVDWASLTGKEQAPKIGATFSDGQDKSVVVQIGGSNPGVGACGVFTPPTSTTTSVPGTSTGTSTSTTSVPGTTTSTTSLPSSTTSTTSTSTGTSTVPSGGGGGTGGGGTGGGVGGGVGGAGGVGGVGGVGGGSAGGGTSGTGNTGSVPGVGAPHTGGSGDTNTVSPLVGSSLVAGGLALATSEAVRRRRQAAGR